MQQPAHTTYHLWSSTVCLAALSLCMMLQTACGGDEFAAGENSGPGASAAGSSAAGSSAAGSNAAGSNAAGSNAGGATQGAAGQSASAGAPGGNQTGGNASAGNGSGGNPSTGGTTGAAGENGAGGMTGAAGDTGSGGTVSSGGSTATGGAGGDTGSGGSVSSGGSSTVGGAGGEAGNGGAGGVVASCPPGTIETKGRCLTFGGAFQQTGDTCVTGNPTLVEGTTNEALCACPAGFGEQVIDVKVSAGPSKLVFCARDDGGKSLWGGLYLLNGAVTEGCYEKNPLANDACTCPFGFVNEYAVGGALPLITTAADWSEYISVSACYPDNADLLSSPPAYETFHGMYLEVEPLGKPAECVTGNPFVNLDKSMCDCLPGDREVRLKVTTHNPQTGSEGLGSLVVCLDLMN